MGSPKVGLQGGREGGASVEREIAGRMLSG